jgi:hypothetical protein
VNGTTSEPKRPFGEGAVEGWSTIRCVIDFGRTARMAEAEVNWGRRRRSRLMHGRRVRFGVRHGRSRLLSGLGWLEVQRRSGAGRAASQTEKGCWWHMRDKEIPESSDSGGGLKTAPPNSDVEADEALGRCAPSGLRSLTPVVMLTRPMVDRNSAGVSARSSLPRLGALPVRPFSNHAKHLS